MKCKAALFIVVKMTLEHKVKYQLNIIKHLNII